MSINGVSASQPATPDRLSSLEPKIFNCLSKYFNLNEVLSINRVNKNCNNAIKLAFSSLTSRHFIDSKGSDAYLAKRIELGKNVSALTFNSCPNIKGACFASLKNLESLKTLWLNNLSIDDSGFRALADATRGKKVIEYVIDNIKIPARGAGALDFVDNISRDIEILNIAKAFGSDYNGFRCLTLLISKLPLYNNLKELGLNRTPIPEHLAMLLAANLPKTVERLYLNQVVITQKVLDALCSLNIGPNLTQCNLFFSAPHRSIETLLRKMPLDQMTRISFNDIKTENLLFISSELSRNKKISVLELIVAKETTENGLYLPILSNLLRSLKSQQLGVLKISGSGTSSLVERLEIMRMVKENLQFWPKIKDLNVFGVTLANCLAPNLPPPPPYQQLLRSGQPIAPVANLSQFPPAAPVQRVISMGRILQHLQPQPLAAGSPEAAPIMGGLGNLVQAARIASGRPSSVISEIEPGDLVQRQQQMANRRAELRDK